MSEDKKDFFDYDSYINNQEKDKEKNKDTKKNKPPQKKKQSAKSGKKKTAEKNMQSEKSIPTDKDKNIQTENVKKKQDKESIENIKRMFDEALDENREELSELTEAPVEPEMPVSNPEGFRRKLYMLFGVVVTLLAIVGLVSTVGFVVDKVKAFADNTQQKNEFAEYIYPIVICDPAPFNQAVKLRSDMVITASLWDIILYEDKSRYETEFDMIVVPELDVEQHCLKLFGTGLNVEHQSVLGADIQFYYDETIKSYRIPANPKYFSYSPYVEEITRVGERYTLLVGYVSPTPAWLALDGDNEPVADKYMEYVVSKRGDEMTLVAIQESEKKGQAYYEHYGIEEGQEE
ncbi:MAG: hypothetical protein J6K17_09070 [Oscillospiraceae bacterium]|nr:hypothetical protein [Oscillospiraceae bacterium]